jgi:hypothetical protein
MYHRNCLNLENGQRYQEKRKDERDKRHSANHDVCRRKCKKCMKSGTTGAWGNVDDLDTF